MSYPRFLSIQCSELDEGITADLDAWPTSYLMSSSSLDEDRAHCIAHLFSRGLQGDLRGQALLGHVTSTRVDRSEAANSKGVKKWMADRQRLLGRSVKNISPKSLDMEFNAFLRSSLG